MEKVYAPQAIERRIYERWESHGWFAPSGNEPSPLEAAEPDVSTLSAMAHAITHQSAARWMRKSASSGVGLPVLPFCAPPW